jgi:hypothetical protein
VKFGEYPKKALSPKLETGLKIFIIYNNLAIVGKQVPSKG